MVKGSDFAKPLTDTAASMLYITDESAMKDGLGTVGVEDVVDGGGERSGGGDGGADRPTTPTPPLGRASRGRRLLTALRPWNATAALPRPAWPP